MSGLSDTQDILTTFEPHSVSSKRLKPTLSLYINMDPKTAKGKFYET